MQNQTFIGAGCVSCGVCQKACPKNAITTELGSRTIIDPADCVNCGICANLCSAGIIISSGASSIKKTKFKNWSDYLWIASLFYFVSSSINIVFAYLGMICFITPLVLALIKRKKSYCQHFCGRSKIFEIVGVRFLLSLCRLPPAFLNTAWFRYSFLIFFMTMFGLVIFESVMVSRGADLNAVLKLFWLIDIPWTPYHPISLHPAMIQFAFGFFSLMLTSTTLGILTGLIFRPRTWCVYCPMGTMTSMISR
jgi:Fe-S-cluster-containing hydrogenase component 2